MPADSSQMRDEVTVDLNGDGSEPPAAATPPIPTRPAEGAAKTKWVEYVTALGMAEDAALERTRDELVELADRLDPQGS